MISLAYRMTAVTDNKHLAEGASDADVAASLSDVRFVPEADIALYLNKNGRTEGMATLGLRPSAWQFLASKAGDHQALADQPYRGRPGDNLQNLILG